MAVSLHGNPATPVCASGGHLKHPNFGPALVVAAGKILQKMHKNPEVWRIEELQTVANQNLIDWRRPSRGGSHVIFSAPGVREIVSEPAKRPIKPVSIKQFLALIDASGGIGKNESTKNSGS